MIESKEYIEAKKDIQRRLDKMGADFPQITSPPKAPIYGSEDYEKDTDAFLNWVPVFVEDVNMVAEDVL